MEREVYRREKNEIQQQFAQHNLEKDMATDYLASAKTVPEEHVRKLKAENRGLLLFLALVIAGLAVLFAVY